MTLEPSLSSCPVYKPTSMPISHPLHPHSLSLVIHLGIMSKNVHVPKFGNWDRDNIQYTAYFENARKDKGGVSQIRNPNDPEENPDAFMAPTVLTTDNDHKKNHPHLSSSPVKQNHKKHQIRDDTERCMEAPTPHVSVRQGEKKSHGRENSWECMEAPTLNVFASQKTSDTQWRRNPRSSFESDPTTSHHRHRSNKSTSDQGGHGMSPLRSPLRGGHGEAQHRRIPSVPKFGDWDETDPKSAEGFTVIFEKVKEEKKFAKGNISSIPNDQMVSTDGEKNRRNSSTFKKACCLFGSADD